MLNKEHRLLEKDPESLDPSGLLRNIQYTSVKSIYVESERKSYINNFQGKIQYVKRYILQDLNVCTF